MCPTKTLALAAALTCAALAPSPAAADTFAAGSLVIPMDVTYQDSGMLKAYGLVYRLLQANVPVRWVIRSGKSAGQVDFTASAVDLKSGAAITDYGYRGGPFVVDAGDAATATPLVIAWQAANPSVVVHRATASFDGDVARTLVAAPKIAVHVDGNQAIAASYLNAAGIPDSQGEAWPLTSPDLLTPMAVAGPTTTDHRDGALFDSGGNPVYCQFLSMHWNVAAAEAAPEVVAEVRQFLGSPTHFFAECQAVEAFENLTPYGHFLTPNGLAIQTQPSTVDLWHADSTFLQLDGTFGTTGGSEPAFALPAGDSYTSNRDVTLLSSRSHAPGTWDVWMTGYLDGACEPAAATCETSGKVSYLGGHEYTVTVPLSTHPQSQGVRLFLNSLFDAPCSEQAGQPQIRLTKTAPATTSSATVTFKLDYGNDGATVALSAVLTDPLPAGATFVSATGGGTLAGSKVSWSLGNLGVGASGSVEVTVTLGARGVFANRAQLDYRVGLTSRSVLSNATSTLYDLDSDGDGVVDTLDLCPSVYDPRQSLEDDPATCGSCSVACSFAHAAAGCAAGSCTLAACEPGFVDCDAQADTGCEYDAAGFLSDPAHCGGCDLACALPHATAACAAGQCAVGTCAEGWADCDGDALDGCEYDASLFPTDPVHCGGCPGVCALAGAQAACVGGSCAIASCLAGHLDLNRMAGDGCEYECTATAALDTSCDGADDDCDGATDEDYLPTTCGVGACEALSACASGESACTPGLSSREGPHGDGSCSNGVDDDCDGTTDEDDGDCREGACLLDADCDDLDPCTEDACDAGNCTHAGGGCGADAGSAGDDAGAAGEDAAAIAADDAGPSGNDAGTTEEDAALAVADAATGTGDAGVLQGSDAAVPAGDSGSASGDDAGSGAGAETGCGCGASSGASAGPLWIALVAAALRRRRR